MNISSAYAEHCFKRNDCITCINIKLEMCNWRSW